MGSGMCIRDRATVRQPFWRSEPLPVTVRTLKNTFEEAVRRILSLCQLPSETLNSAPLCSVHGMHRFTLVLLYSIRFAKPGGPIRGLSTTRCKVFLHCCVIWGPVGDILKSCGRHFGVIWGVFSVLGRPGAPKGLHGKEKTISRPLSR